MTTLTAVEHQQGLRSLIDLYLLRCQVEGKSPNTITAYRETLTLFQGIAGEEGFPEDVRAIARPTSTPTWDASAATERAWRRATAAIGRCGSCSPG
jgi:hypothetical protein